MANKKSNSLIIKQQTIKFPNIFGKLHFSTKKFWYYCKFDYFCAENQTNSEL